MIKVEDNTYKKNSLGHLVPVAQIPARILAEDELVTELFAQARWLQNILATWKYSAMSSIACFVNDVGEELGVDNASQAEAFVTLSNYEGNLKVKIAKGTHMFFGCDLSAAKALVQACIRDWEVGAMPQYQAIAQHAFPTDKEGDINPAKLWELTSLFIEGDDRWNNAMKAIRQSVRYEFKKPYLRLHCREKDTRWEMLTLDLAAINKGDGAGAAPVDLPGLLTPVKPIRTEEDYRKAMEQVKAMMAGNPEADSPEGEKLEVLASLCEGWELRSALAVGGLS